MKINLDPEKSNALARLLGVGGAGVEALRELFDTAEAELVDVRNIDPKGNMGLQALAAQKALEAVQEVKAQIFPSEKGPARAAGTAENGPRKYQ